MGYTTDFDGCFETSRPLTTEEYDYLVKFSESRRMGRKIVSSDPKDLEKLTKCPGKDGFGNEGEYIVDDNLGQDIVKVIDVNTPPGQIPWSKDIDFHTRYIENQRRSQDIECQPSLWCNWIPEDANYIVWNGAEKFYNYVDWIKYMIKHFFEPWGIKLNGTVRWFGEDRDDVGAIQINDNDVKVLRMTFVE